MLQESNSFNYQLPTWAQNPKNNDDVEWILEEIKSGTVVNKYKLDLPVTTFGRAASPLFLGNGECRENVHFKSIHTAHESCSRLHARLAFDSTGTPWLRDLGSGNGTTINKKNLPKQSIGKRESSSSSSTAEGSRGVIIYPGDVIQFGASTRIYVLNGPSFYDRGAVKARRQIMQQQMQQNKREVNKNDDVNVEDDNGISWGINFDDHEDDFTTNTSAPSQTSKSLDNTYQNQGLDHSTPIPEKYRKLHHKIQSKKFKLNNIQTEMKRIQAKAMSIELSSGQQSQLDKNEKRELLLQNEIKSLEDELLMKLDRRKSANMKTTAKNTYDSDSINEDDDVDDFYDRTKTTSKRLKIDGEKSMNRFVVTNNATASKHNEVEDVAVETIESLSTKWKILLEKLQNQSQRTDQSQRQVNQIRQDIQQQKEKGCSNDDYFFLQNDLVIANDEHKKMKEELKGIQQELNSTEKMILIINDKLVFDRKLLFIGLNAELDKLVEDKKQKEQTVQIAMEMKHQNEKNLMMPPPPQRKVSVNNKNRSSDDLMPPPPPMLLKGRGKMHGPDIPSLTATATTSQITHSSPIASNSSTLTDASKNEKVTKRKRNETIRPSTFSTLQAIQQGSKISYQNEDSLKGSEKRNARNKKDVINNALPDFNPKVDQWVAPKEQDGSGRTKLNAKFGGRY